MSVSTPARRKSSAPAAPAAGPRTLSQALRQRRGDLLAEACPSREVLKHVTSRWGVLVLMALEAGPQRFSELRRTIGGVSERMLAQTLQWLEGDGLVLRVALAVVPPHVEYSLTRLGIDAARRVRGLADWIELNVHQVQAHQARQAQQAEQAKTSRARPGVKVHRLV